MKQRKIIPALRFLTIRRSKFARESESIQTQIFDVVKIFLLIESLAVRQTETRTDVHKNIIHHAVPYVAARLSIKIKYFHQHQKCEFVYPHTPSQTRMC